MLTRNGNYVVDSVMQIRLTYMNSVYLCIYAVVCSNKQT